MPDSVKFHGYQVKNVLKFISDFFIAFSDSEGILSVDVLVLFSSFNKFWHIFKF